MDDGGVGTRTSARWRTWRRVVAGLGMVALVAAGCDDDDPTSAGSTTSSSSTAGGTPAATACPDVSIAFLGSQSGPEAAHGLNQSRGVELAIDEYNAAASSRCDVRFQSFDATSSIDATPVVAQRIVQDASIVGLVGPTSNVALGAMPILEAAGIPVISPSASDASLSLSGWTVFHRAIANTDEQAAATARYVTGALAARSVAVLDDGSDAGRRRAKVLAEAIAKTGATVAAEGLVGGEVQDDAATVAEVKAADVDAVVFGGDAELASRLTKQLRAAGVAADLVLGESSLDPRYLSGSGAAAEGVVIVAAASWSVDRYSGGPAFGVDFENALGQPPGLYAAEAYDAARFLLAALAAGAVTRPAISAYLDTNEQAGVTKQLVFDADGELAGDPTVYANTVQGGVLVGLGPIAG
jgi:branched-chain amino acid transport system substrate-binding protein